MQSSKSGFEPSRTESLLASPVVRIAVRLAGIVMLLFFAYMLCHIQNQLIELKNNPKPRPTAAGRAAG